MNARSNRRPWQLVKLLSVFALACLGCIAATALALNLNPRLLLVALGLKHAGSLESVLPPEPPPLTLVGQAQDGVHVVLPPRFVDPLPLSAADLGGPVIGDASTPGTTTYLLTADEAGLNRLLRRGIFSDAVDDGRYRNLEIDLQPHGLVLYADVDLGLRSQRMGLLLLQGEGDLTLSPAGVVLDQQLYALSEGGTLARVVLPAGREIQRTFRALTVVGPLPGEARVDGVRFYADRLQILARAVYPTSAPADTGWQRLEPGVEWREIDVVVGADGPTERLRIVRVSPHDVEFRVRYDPAEPRNISAWGSDADSLLVVNGGYFAAPHEGNETIGLLVSDGQRWGTPLADYAGMFAVDAAGDVSVRWLRHSPYDPQEPLAHAVQSFPVLVKPGGVMGFPAEADEGVPGRRTVIAQDFGGNVLFIVGPAGYLSLHELAVFLAESDLGIDVALNLDGGGSTGMWMVAGEATVEIDSLTPVPSVIAVERR